MWQAAANPTVAHWSTIELLIPYPASSVVALLRDLDRWVTFEATPQSYWPLIRIIQTSRDCGSGADVLHPHWGRKVMAASMLQAKQSPHVFPACSKGGPSFEQPHFEHVRFARQHLVSHFPSHILKGCCTPTKLCDIKLSCLWLANVKMDVTATFSPYFPVILKYCYCSQREELAGHINFCWAL